MIISDNSAIMIPDDSRSCPLWYLNGIERKEIPSQGLAGDENN